MASLSSGCGDGGQSQTPSLAALRAQGSVRGQGAGQGRTSQPGGPLWWFPRLACGDEPAACLPEPWRGEHTHLHPTEDGAEGVSLPPSSPESPHRFLCSSGLLEAARSPGFVALHPQGQRWPLRSFLRCLPPTRTLCPPSSVWKDLCNSTGPGDSRGISLTSRSAD